MASAFFRLSKDVLIYGLGNALGRLVSVITAPILTWYFVPSDYGAIALSQTVVGCLVLFMSLGLDSGVFRYYYEVDDPAERRSCVSTGLYFNILTGILVALGLFVSSGFLADLLAIRIVEAGQVYPYAKFLEIMALGVPFSLLNSHFFSILRLQRRAWSYVLVSASQVVVNISLVLFVVVILSAGIEGVLFAGVVTNLIVALLSISLLWRSYNLSFSFSFLGLFLAYCLPQFPSVLMNWGLSQSNRFFINYYSTLEEQGYYAIALRFASLLLLFVTAFRLAWDPFAMSKIKEEGSSELFARTYHYYSFLFVLLCAFVSVAAKPVLMLLTPEAYWPAHTIVFMLAFSFVYQGGNNILGVGIAISKRTKFISYAQVSALLVNVFLNFLLIPRFGAWGAAGAYLCGVFVQSLSVFVFSQIVHKINYQFCKTQILNVFVFLYIFSFLMIFDRSDLLIYSFASLLCLLILVPVVWFSFISKSDRAAFYTNISWRFF